MSGPPPVRRIATPSIRLDEKQGRAFEGTRTVRVFGARGNFIVALNSLRDGEQISRLLAAPNTEAVHRHSGGLTGIRVLSFGNDWGGSGERHGRSTVTTERVRNDIGMLIGGDQNLKHKAENVKHASRPPAWMDAVQNRSPIEPPLARK